MSPSHPELPSRPGLPFLHRVRLRNYKSIGQADVRLGRFTLLVGRNGSGKSNFLDALRFVTDSLQSSLDHALKERAGISAVRRISTGHPRNFAIDLWFLLESQAQMCHYGFEIAAGRQGDYVIKREELKVLPPGRSQWPAGSGPAGASAAQESMFVSQEEEGPSIARYLIADGAVRESTARSLPPLAPDRLFLVNAAGLPEFRAAYDGLTSMGFYNLNPQVIRDLQSPDAGELLLRDGSNLASVIGRLAREAPELKERIEQYLEAIVPGVEGVDRIALGPKETLQFRQRIHGAEHPWKFYAASMSDGTLRALGVLVAAAQIAHRKHPATFVGIEEPEIALHPAAAGALMDALRSASQRTQIALTSHSPDLLDNADLDTDTILAVRNDQGTTQIGRIDKASFDAIKGQLYTAGELLRMDQLEPDQDDLRRQLDLPQADVR